ncbi:MAG: folylpolyglutamate synthase/dihydrofolate synthase family protein, partial [Deltaproteobacteria bacterium]
MPSRKEILGYLYGLEARGIKPGLSRIKKLLRALGGPQKKYPSIHVAGTNGKGSTSAFLFSILGDAGFSTGLYTSPHLHRFNERIRTSAGPISDRDIVLTALKVRKAADGAGQDVSFFEFTTAMAFEYFREKKVEIAVVETGMGGRWDATNAVSPLVSIITNVGLDHTEYLGDGIEAIAREKAGIIKKGVPLITGVAKGPALKALRAAANRKRSRVFCLDKDFAFARKPGRRPFDYAGISRSLKNLSSGLIGAHQCVNASCAIAALEAIEEKGYNIPAGSIRRGLKEVDWPGRVEVAG